MKPSDFYAESFTTIIGLTYRSQDTGSSVLQAFFSDSDSLNKFVQHRKIEVLGHSTARLYHITALPPDPKSLSPTLPLCDD